MVAPCGNWGNPPPTNMASVVTYAESSDARNKAILAISSGVPTLPDGTSFLPNLVKRHLYSTDPSYLKEGNYGKDFLLTLGLRILSFTILLKMRIPSQTILRSIRIYFLLSPLKIRGIQGGL
jgi:hypothetical protein